MSAAVIDFATRELRRNRTEPESPLKLAPRPFGIEGDLDLARALVAPRSPLGPLFGLTSRDLDFAVARIQKGTRFTPTTEYVKRLLDLMLSIPALVLLSPFALLIAVAIRLDSPGPIFYRQQRVGRGGREFQMIRFRSMKLNAEETLRALHHANEGNGLLFKMKLDPRVTRVGRFLRKYSLDELPQLLNVLTGDMSIVGPRPPLPQEVAGYGLNEHRRLYVKPGITGMWQVSGRSDLSWEESVRLDLYYIENWSLGVDFAIMWRTVKTLIHSEDAY